MGRSGTALHSRGRGRRPARCLLIPPDWEREQNVKGSIKAAAQAALFTAAFAVAPLANAKLLITEAMPDPSGTDADREWFEIFNSGLTAVNLTGYGVGDGLSSTSTSGGEALGQFPDGTTIAAGQVMIIAIRNAGFTSLYGATRPGLKADFEFANALLNTDGTSATTLADD